MSTIELAMMVDFTVPNFVAKDETDNTCKQVRYDMTNDTERRQGPCGDAGFSREEHFVYIVVIHGWREATAEPMQALAAILGVTVFEMRQRMMGDGPAVVASFADPHQAGSLAEKLRQCGVSTLVVDAAEARSRSGRFMVRRFELCGRRLSVEAVGGETAEIPFEEVALLFPAICIVGQSETVTVTERKLNIRATLLSGGIPMMKKVVRQEEVRAEEREKALFLYAGNSPAVVFRQNGMTYDGLGGAMKASRELNFALLAGELRRLSANATHDDRLLQRAGQVRVLGPL